MEFAHVPVATDEFSAAPTHVSNFITSITMFHISCLSSVEPSGNGLMTCGNPTRPTSLVTTTGPDSTQQHYSTARKITAVAMAATCLQLPCGSFLEWNTELQEVMSYSSIAKINHKHCGANMKMIRYTTGPTGFTGTCLFFYRDQCGLPHEYNVMSLILGITLVSSLYFGCFWK